MESHYVANLLMEKVNKQLELPSIQTACTTSQEHPSKISEQEALFGYSLLKQ